MKRLLCTLLSLAAFTQLFAQQELKTAQKAVSFMQKGNYAALLKSSSEEFRRQIDASGMSNLMNQVSTQFGSLKSITLMQQQTVQGMEQFSYKALFENDSLLLLMAVKGKTIMGFFLKPLEPVNTYSKPAYGSGFQLSQREFTYGVPGFPLDGQLMWPARYDETRLPVCILIHGSGPNDMDESIGPNKVFMDLALGLCKNGIGTLRYNKRTFQHGKTYADGQITLHEEVTDDVRAMIDFAMQQSWVDTTRIYLVGHSQGAIVAPSIMAADPRVAGVVLLCGSAEPLTAILRYQLGWLDSMQSGRISAETRKQQQMLDSFRTQEWIQSQPGSRLFMGAPLSWWNEIDQVFKPEHLHQPGKRSLVLNAGKDYQIPPTFYASLQAGCKAGLIEEDTIFGDNYLNIGRSLVNRCQAKEYPELNHLMMPSDGSMKPAEYKRKDLHVDEQLIKDIADWIKEQ
jgi:pimeloyl-ACP methyl ester carboxylesterase